jgi:hypothetical protein
LLLRVDIETREAWVRSVDVKRGGGR